MEDPESMRREGPRCYHCGERCYGYGFSGEMVGGCKKRREEYTIAEAKRILGGKEVRSPEDKMIRGEDILTKGRRK